MTAWRQRFCTDCGHVDDASAFEFVGPFGPNWNEEGDAERVCPRCEVHASTSDFPVYSRRAYLRWFGRPCQTCGARSIDSDDKGNYRYPADCRHDPVRVLDPVARSIPKGEHVHAFAPTASGAWQCVREWPGGPGGCGLQWAPRPAVAVPVEAQESAV